MKKTLLTLALVGLSTAATFAQGTIQFANTALSKLKYEDAPGVALVDAPVGTVVGVWWGNNAADTFGGSTTIANAGVFNAGATYALAGSAENARVFLQIAGWLNKGGATPSTVDRTTKAGVTHYGESGVVQATLGPTAGPGTVVWQSGTGTNAERMKPFNIVQVVPEPSMIALGALGLGALLLRRRKA